MRLLAGHGLEATGILLPGRGLRDPSITAPPFTMLGQVEALRFSGTIDVAPIAMTGGVEQITFGE
jgi:hypothetical protein